MEHLPITGPDREKNPLEKVVATIVFAISFIVTFIIIFMATKGNMGVSALSGLGISFVLAATVICGGCLREKEVAANVERGSNTVATKPYVNTTTYTPNYGALNGNQQTTQTPTSDSNHNNNNTARSKR